MADNLLMTLKKIVNNTVKSMVMCDNLIGTVVSTSPLKIAINEKMVLEEIHFIKLKHAFDNKGKIKKGTKVVLSRCLGGEQYVILGELIE